MKKYDIVICVGLNDLIVIEDMIKLIRINVIGYKKIYLIVSEKNYNYPKDCIIIDEKNFPFTKEEITKYLPDNEKYRGGWYYQQILKLYCCFVIKCLYKNYVIIDADTFFLKQINFFDKETKLPIYNVTSPNNKEYYAHMTRMHPSLTQQIEGSGIANYMLFQKKYIKRLFKLISEYHNGEKFYKIFMKSVDKNKSFAGASEYETYITYMLKYNANKIKLCKIKNDSIMYINQPIEEDVVYVNYHWFNRVKNEL